MKKLIIFVKNNFLLSLFFLLALFSLPSLYRVYQISPLYFSPAARQGVLLSLDALRSEFAYAATDLKLKRVKQAGAELVFVYDYSYHYPDRSVLSDQPRRLEVRLLENQLAGISTLE